MPPVVCSPVLDQKEVSGVLVQIFCKTHVQAGGDQTRGKSRAQEGQKDSPGEKMDDFVDHEETALDRQPFFQKFAEMLPTGLAILNHKADPLFVNHQFHDLTAHQGPDHSFRMWPETIHPEDHDRVMSEYQRAFESQTELEIEFRAFGESQWRLFLMRPLGKNNLRQFSLREFGGYICALIDVSDMKNAELAQTRVAKEARERKQQQERFIDMISHEIRNPLSAVLHCTEDILDAVQDGEIKPEKIIVDDIVEAVHTIQLCVDHQKTLVDDVLSFSKLDASMLSLAPRQVRTATRPKSQMADTLKIFQPELRKQKIEFGYTIKPEYDSCQVDWVMADLVRISQVIVNLMTNAIKFTTKQERKKKITIEVAAALERPPSYPPDVVFFQTDDVGLKTDATGNPEWGDGEPLYIMVAVKDSGIGISKENQAKLFERFQQATPKTGQMYGGSGLGLNISRKMCQLHGGEIGVSSVEGEGSTFGFFFRVRRSGQPDDADRLEPKELSDRLKKAGHKRPSEVNEQDLPDNLKSLTDGAAEQKNTEAPPKDRWQRTTDISDQMSTKNDGSKTVGDQGEKSHSRAQDDMSQKVQKRPANAGRSSEPPDPTFETTKPAHLEKGDSKAKGKEAGTKDDKDAHQDKQEVWRSSQNEKSNIQSDSRPTILFVEDNLINQKLLKKKIESKGFQVTTAENGKEALDIITARSSAQQPPFDCVLMDQEMPVMDGKTASREIRKFEGDNDLPNVNIIGVTANVREEQQTAMTDAGMNDVIAKPFKMEDLLEKVRRGSK
ncbi:hypothetical protein D6C77_06589 [Aureobasidium pullulans]|nr:hypothetical protein D6C77_06589 [Aureobasidium pullulans]